jgi:hypothetical protein
MPNNIETAEKALKRMNDIRAHLLNNKPVRAFQSLNALCEILCNGLEANHETLGISREIMGNIIAPKRDV